MIIYSRIIILYLKNFLYPDFIKYTRLRLLDIFGFIYIKFEFKDIVSIDNFPQRLISIIVKRKRIDINFNNNFDILLNILGKIFDHNNSQ